MTKTLERRQAALTIERNELLARKMSCQSDWTAEEEQELQETIEALNSIVEKLRRAYTAEGFLELGREFGFSMSEQNSKVSLRGKTTDGKYCNWMVYEADNDSFTVKGNSDYFNFWLHLTRPDLTPEKLVEFNNRLNEIMQFEEKMELCAYVDPEDWQEIADINDAYEDERYRAKRVA